MTGTSTFFYTWDQQKFTTVGSQLLLLDRYILRTSTRPLFIVYRCLLFYSADKLIGILITSTARQ